MIKTLGYDVRNIVWSKFQFESVLWFAIDYTAEEVQSSCYLRSLFKKTCANTVFIRDEGSKILLSANDQNICVIFWDERTFWNINFRRWRAFPILQIRTRIFET